jgi:iron complex outermembrane recepter protein
MNFVRLMLLSVVVLAAQWLTSGARATDTGVQPADTSIDEIVVTAQKRKESVQDVPASITALTAAMIEQKGIRDVSDLQFEIPTLMFGSQAGLTQIFLRGVGLNTGTGEIQGGVAVNVDGIYQPHPGTGDEGQLDLERVEVLKGPQGTLYGRNATGGAVNFITAAPSSTFEANATLGYANYDTLHASGKLSGPVADNVRASIAADYYDQHDGFVRNVNGGPDLDYGRKEAVRLKVSIDLTSSATLDLALYDFDQAGPFIYDVAAYPAIPALVAVEPRLENAVYTFKPWETTDKYPSQLERNNHSLAATLTWDLGGTVLTSRSSYQVVDEHYIIDADGESSGYDQFLRNDYMHNLVEELNVSSHVGIVDVLGGVFFMHENLDLFAGIQFPEGAYFGVPPGYLLPFGYDLSETTYAGYFDSTVHVTDRLRLIAGARYTVDDRTSFQNLFDEACVATTKVDGEKVTGRGVIQYDVAPAQNVYGSVSTGYRNGGVALSVCQDVYKPETITAYEVGYKGRFPHGITFNAAAFYYDYRNLQLNEVRTNEGQLVVTLINVPTAYIRGLEFESEAQPGNHWRFDVSGSYLNATYGTFYNIDSQLPARNLGLQNVTGNELNYSPKWSATVGLEYKSSPIANAGTVTARLEEFASAQYFLTEFNTAPYTQGGYAIANAFLTWNATDHYSTRLWIKNIADRAIVRSLIAQDLVGTNLITFNDPRQFGIDVNYKF